MDGVVSIMREFSSDYITMRDEYKYMVEYFEDGVSITYMDKEDGKWVKKQSMLIDPTVSELLFRTITKDFDDGNANIGF